ncbi:MAG TPA: DUF1579 family protein [Blastocatellia bacterium]|nr:DUF1579 family protein [Blastocatellia bacterium]
MGKARRTAIGAVVAALVFSLAAVMAQEHGKDKQVEGMQPARPGPEMEKIKFQLGTWKTTEKHEAGQGYPGGEGKGTMVVRPGPGGLSLIMEYTSSSSVIGPFSGLGITVWDAEARTYKNYWVDSFTAGLMEMTGNWQGKDFVLTGQAKQMGKTYTMKEVITDITPTSYTLKMYMSEDGGPEWLAMTIKAVKK